MQQILLVVTAIILGLGLGALTGGFAFSSAVCLIAGVFLVTPSLFKFQLSDISLIKSNLPSFGRNLWINYLLLTTVALGIGYLSGDIGIAGALFLLALLPGGGMVMMWIKSSGANAKLGFIIFMLNLALLLPVTLIFGAYFDLAQPFFPTPDLGATEGLASSRQIKPIAPFMILIVVPFLISRLIRNFLPGVMKFSDAHGPLISKLTMFGIVLYLFSLSSAQVLFTVPLSALVTALIATIAFYVVAFLAARFLTPESPEGRAVYWHIATRYITLALILAIFVVDQFGATFILPIMFAYFIQIGAAGFLRSKMLARKPAIQVPA